MKTILVLFGLMVILLLMIEQSKASVRSSHHVKRIETAYESQTKSKNRAVVERNKKGVKKSSSKFNYINMKQNEKNKGKLKEKNMKAERSKGKKRSENKKSKHKTKKEKKRMRLRLRKNQRKNNKINNRNVAQKRKLLKKGKGKKKYKQKKKIQQKKKQIKWEKLKYYKHKRKTNNIKQDKKPKTTNNSSRLGTPIAQCEFKFMSDMKKDRRKYQVVQAKLQRIVAFWDLLTSKKTKAELPTATFQSPFGSLSRATNGGTTCGCGPIPTVPFEIYTKLSKCTATAAWACSTDDIIYDDQVKKCNTALGTTCDASCTVTSGTSPSCPANCAAVGGSALAQACSDLVSEERYELTPAMITHMRGTCIPQLNAWNARYTSCGTHYPTTDCKDLCQSDANAHDCQVEKCTCENGGAVPICDYERCLHNEHSSVVTTGLTANQIQALIQSKSEPCQCKCFKQLDSSLFPIDKRGMFSPTTSNLPEWGTPDCPWPYDPKKEGCRKYLNCLDLSAFDRLIKTRKDRCIKAGGITEAENKVTNPALSGPPIPPFPQAPTPPLGPGAGLTPLSPMVGQRDSGNFGDCRFQAREAFPWIYTCMDKSTCTAPCQFTISIYYFINIYIDTRSVILQLQSILDIAITFRSTEGAVGAPSNFKSIITAMNQATMNGTSCNGVGLSDEAKNAYAILTNCSVSVPAICDGYRLTAPILLKQAYTQTITVVNNAECIQVMTEYTVLYEKTFNISQGDIFHNVTSSANEAYSNQTYDELDALKGKISELGCLTNEIADINDQVKKKLAICLDVNVKGSFGSCMAAKDTAIRYITKCKTCEETSSLTTAGTGRLRKFRRIKA